MQHQYLLQYDTIKDYSVADFIACLSSTEGLLLKELKMSDLIFVDGEPIVSAMGVYLFKEGDQIIYVGKCSSRCFVDRIPAHFDIRSGAWFNSLLKTMVNKIHKKAVGKYYTFELEAKEALDKYSLVLINFPHNERSQINHIEDLLRCNTTAYNGFKGKRYTNMDLLIKNYHSKHHKIKL